jgi:hypothetical protein
MSSKTPPTLPDVLDDILETLSAEAFIFGNYALGKGVATPLPDDSHELPPVDKAKAAILTAVRQFVVDIIGEDEESDFEVGGEFNDFCNKCDFIPTDDTTHCICYYRNKLRAEQRKQLLTALGEEQNT